MRVQSLDGEDSHGGGNGNPLQYSCLENPMDGTAWQATVHRVTKSWTQLKQLSTQHAMQKASIRSLHWEDHLELESDNPLQLWLQGTSHGQRNLVGCSPRGRKEWDTA